MPCRMGFLFIGSNDSQFIFNTTLVRFNIKAPNLLRPTNLFGLKVIYNSLDKINNARKCPRGMRLRSGESTTMSNLIVCTVHPI